MKKPHSFTLIMFVLLLTGCGKHGEEPKNDGRFWGKSSIASDVSAASSTLPPLVDAFDMPKAPPQKNQEYYLEKAKILIPAEVSKLQKDSDTGDVEAQIMMATIYINGLGVEKDISKGLELMRKAAEKGNAFAQDVIGALLIVGINKSDAKKTGTLVVKKDIPRGFALIEKSAAQGNVDALWQLGRMYSKGDNVQRDELKAIEYYERAAGLGYVEDQIELAEKFEAGNEISKNYVKAAEWFGKAAQQGDMHGQQGLGSLYLGGHGVPKDYQKGLSYLRKSAAQGFAVSQLVLGNQYRYGDAIEKNYIYSYAWYILAATRQSDYKTQVDSIEINLSLPQKIEGQRLASNWKIGDMYLEGESSQVTSAVTPSNGIISKQSTGTAFTVSSEGHALTNHHVINGCTEVRVAGREGVVKVITSDSVNDLALLQLPGKTNDIAHINSEPGKIRQGEDIIVFGYPLNYVLSSGGNLTPGTVSALTGVGNNTNQIQITAPIQPGSSGSPVMDKNGNVMGVVSMKLDDIKMAKATGSVGQNVNFAVNGQTVKAFLDTNNVPYKTGGGFFSREKSNADIAEEARKWTVLVECWK